VRPLIESFAPSSYIGIDIQAGKSVDLVLDAEKILDHFGHHAFDAVISTEALEHVVDWKLIVNNMKETLKPGGYIYVTVCPSDMGCHLHPQDCWRFNVEDMAKMFSDFQIIKLDPGTFLKARKPKSYVPLDLSEIAIYSMISKTKTKEVII